jgi:hypothetical protein
VAVQVREDGHSLREIAAELTARGIPTVRGRSWYASNVRKLLAAPAVMR